jgi:hypothetical protein
MRHQIEVILGIAILAGLGFATWTLVTGPLADHFHSHLQAFYGALTMMLIVLAIVTGTIIGAWDAKQETPRSHHHFHFRELFHH